MPNGEEFFQCSTSKWALFVDVKNQIQTLSNTNTTYSNAKFPLSIIFIWIEILGFCCAFLAVCHEVEQSKPQNKFALSESTVSKFGTNIRKKQLIKENKISFYEYTTKRHNGHSHGWVHWIKIIRSLQVY